MWMTHAVGTNEVMYFIFLLCFNKTVAKVWLDVLLEDDSKHSCESTFPRASQILIRQLCFRGKCIT